EPPVLLRAQRQPAAGSGAVRLLGLVFGALVVFRVLVLRVVLLVVRLVVVDRAARALERREDGRSRPIGVEAPRRIELHRALEDVAGSLLPAQLELHEAQVPIGFARDRSRAATLAALADRPLEL